MPVVWARFVVLTFGTLALIALAEREVTAGGRRDVNETFEDIPSGALPAEWSSPTGGWAVEGGQLIGQGGDRPTRVELPAGISGAVEIEVELRPTVHEEGFRFVVELSTAHGEAVHAISWSEPTGRPRIEHYAHTSRSTSLRCHSATPRRLEATPQLRLRAGNGRIRLWAEDSLLLDSSLAADLEPSRVAFSVENGSVAIRRVGVRSLGPSEVDELRVDWGRFRKVPITAHRGASAEAPENTLKSLRQGAAYGADAVEFDVHALGDGTLVVLHDHDLRRTTDVEAVFPNRDPHLNGWNLAELKRLDAGSWKGKEHVGERIPTFAEALEALSGRATSIVEIKPRDIGRAVAEAIRAAHVEREVLVISFEPDAIRDVHAVLPEVPTGFLTSQRLSEDGRERARQHLRDARRVSASAIICHYTLIDGEYVRELHRHAMSVWVYTVDDPIVFDQIVRLGVDGVITNLPAKFVEYTRDRASAR